MAFDTAKDFYFLSSQLKKYKHPGLGVTWQESPWYPDGQRHYSTSNAWARPL